MTTSETIAALQALKALLRLEKEEDLRQYNELIKNLPLEERRQKGVSWHPVQIVKTGYGIGNRAVITIERTNHLDAPNKFRAGKTINLFTKTAHVSRPERTGVIHFTSKNKMKIILNTKDIPDWIDMGSIGVDLMFDERTYQEMEKALDQVMKAKNNRLAELRAILLGNAQPLFEKVITPIQLPQLNASQNEAVTQIKAAIDVAIVHGPPGTGKTTTLVQAIKLLSQTESTILVCAPSNAAVDLLTERLAEQELRVVRIGNISRIDESLIQHTLEGRLSAHPEYKTVKKIKKQAAEMRRKANQYKRKFGHQERNERRQHFQEAKELGDWANQLEDKIVDQILSTAHVITCTLVGCTSRYVDKLEFQTVVIDEAGQALHPATWIPILRTKRVIMAGDPLQLPPTVKSKEAQRKGFNITLMEKGIQYLPTSLLTVQYRMHQIIMGFSNQEFYKNQLQADATVKEAVLLLNDGDTTPLEFIDTAGCGFSEIINEEYQSRYNPDEFNILREHLYQLLATTYDNNLPSIGIISPYREQVIYMQEAIKTDSDLADYELDINTIDAFQGQERDVIYISLVRSNEKGQIGFLSDYRRMNVAMTRAKRKLVVVGDSATLGNHTFYQNFLSYCEKVDAYKSAWEYMS